MKQGIHPIWYNDAQVTCACGNTFTTGSIKPSIRVEICSKCHPLFTGQQKFVDILGQVDRFVKKTAISKTKQAERAKIIETRQTKVQKKREARPTLKELLIQARKQVDG